MSRHRAWWQVLVDWRNWRLRTKVGAVLAVPVVAAVALGTVQLRAELGTADGYAAVQRLVDLRAALIPLVADLQRERTLAAEPAPVDPAARGDAAASVDGDLATVVAKADALDPNTPAAARYRDLVDGLAGLPSVRARASAGGDVRAAVTDYGALVGAALAVDRALTAQLGDPQLAGPATALHDLEVAGEQVRLQQVVLLAGAGRGRLAPADVAAVQAAQVRLADRLGEVRAVLPPDRLAAFQQAYAGAMVTARDRTVSAAAAGPFALPVGDWNRESDAVAGRLAGVAASLADGLRATAADLRDRASASAAQLSGVLLAVLLLAITVGFVVGRHLLRSLGVLRRTALAVAERGLPRAVASIRAGRRGDLAVEPVPVHTTEELGELARAFDAVHGEAVRCAAAQASLRATLRDTFANLSRRSQGLVERQLRLMEQLERNEQDPAQLANLFALDHLATRMRRNNENLLVLAGGNPVRRSTRPMPLSDVLRAAVSEIEQYQRVVVRSTPAVDILGYVAGDVVRLVAELLDNATAFSAPGTQVHLGGNRASDGAVGIVVSDGGIGMSEDELTEARRRVSGVDTADVPVSRQLGLYVVGRLARRHAIEVSLAAEPEAGGLVAAVSVPAELITPSRPADEPAVVPPAAPAPRRPDEPTAVAYTAAGLPVRVPRPPVAPRRDGTDAAPRRDPLRARGLFADYQAGVRRGAGEPPSHAREDR